MIIENSCGMYTFGSIYVKHIKKLLENINKIELLYVQHYDQVCFI